MREIEINGRVFPYEDIKSYIKKEQAVHGKPAYVYLEYSSDKIDSLYMLNQITNAAHVLMLVKNSDVDSALKHMNIFDQFTFTLVPELIRADFYEKLYKFYFYSPLSITYVTWISKLFVMPRAKVNIAKVGGGAVCFSRCPDTCPLVDRNCSKEYLFTELFHPLRGVPTDEEMNRFCLINIDSSRELAKEIESSVLELDAFERTKKGMRIQSQYWIDPLSIL